MELLYFFFFCTLFLFFFHTWVRLKAMALYIIMFGLFCGFGHYSFVHLTFFFFGIPFSCRQ